VKHYGEGPLDTQIVTAASDGRRVYVTLLATLKRNARVKFDPFLREASATAIYEIIRSDGKEHGKAPGAG